MKATHYAFRTAARASWCSYKLYGTPQVTTDIEKVTCKACLKDITKYSLRNAS